MASLKALIFVGTEGKYHDDPITQGLEDFEVTDELVLPDSRRQQSSPSHASLRPDQR